MTIGPAVEVGGALEAVRINIGSRVADGDFAHTTAITVQLHVTSDGLDIRGGVCVVGSVDDLVT